LSNGLLPRSGVSGRENKGVFGQTSTANSGLFDKFQLLITEFQNIYYP
jgi:hypothetical protein